MRIGMMADIYKPHVSGVTQYISLNKRYLEKLGHQVYVFTFSYEGYEDDEPNVVRSPSIPVLDTGFYVGFRYPSKISKLLRTMDVVHVHHPFLSGSLALRYCRSRHIPVVFTNHTRYDLYAQAYLPVISDVISAAAMQAYMPAFCRACDLVISPSPGMRNVLTSYGVDAPIDVVPNGVDLKPFQGPVEPIEREKLGFEPDDVVLAFVGRLGPEKNVPFLLRSFSGTVQAYPHVGLLLIGEGPERDNLEDRARRSEIESRVHFTGLVPYDLLPRYLAAVDAFVTASVTEVHPFTVIEAMASGLPVLGIDSPGIGDTIQDGETGYLVSREDLAAFTAKMVRLVADRQSRQKMGEQARIASHAYAIERTTQMMLERYQKVVDQSQEHKRGIRARLSHWIGGLGK
jgi:glycosyltransferase involved in cell wall biosynthesis